MENPIKMDDFGGFPIIFGNTQIKSTQVCSVEIAANFLFKLWFDLISCCLP